MNIKEKYLETRSWLRYHLFSRSFYPLLNTVLTGYPWDHVFLYDLERAKIGEMCKYHEGNRFVEKWVIIVRDMKICMNLIDIFSEKRDLFHYTGDMQFKPTDIDDAVEVDTSGLKYHCDVYVNTRTVDRFLTKEQQKYYHPHELYIAKAKTLYHKIRLERDATWWD